MTTRREILALGAGVAIAGPALAQLPPNIAELRRVALEEAVRKITGGAPVRKGRVKLDVPPLIDNGNAVPIAVSVESPMTAQDFVRSIHVFTEKNPQPYVIQARLGPRSGAARLATRARIADTGNVLALAQLSDGSFWSDSVHVVVTLAACLEDGLI
jgi:sulfur-oxidizing protein SoxY